VEYLSRTGHDPSRCLSHGATPSIGQVKHLDRADDILNHDDDTMTFVRSMPGQLHMSAWI
jgi:hypothetical protein